MFNATIGVRVSLEDKRILEKICDARGEDVSDFVRRVVRKELAALSFYPDDVKKALGVLKEA